MAVGHQRRACRRLVHERQCQSDAGFVGHRSLHRLRGRWRLSVSRRWHAYRDGAGDYTHESQNLIASAAAAGIPTSKYNLDQIRANVSYWYQNTYGLTAGWQKTWGPANPILFAGGGSVNNKPNSNAFIIEADWVPFGKDTSYLAPYLNLKLGVQYTIYTQFNGGGSNYDGAGANAGDNNTLLVFAWLIF